MAEAKTVAELVSVPPAQRGQDWLQDALQTAVELEFATIPPYLCAVWSISDTTHAVYDLLHEVVMEEMCHLGLACNMLTAIGGTPWLKPNAVRNYPCPLPGGVRPGLVVPLRGLTWPDPKTVLSTFMQIERAHHDQSEGGLPDDSTPTIGDLYDAIQGAFKSLPDGAVTGKRQLTRTFATVENLQLTAIHTPAAAVAAIDLIKEEGEGTAVSPFDPSEESPADLAHYYRFEELYQGKSLVKNSQGHWVFDEQSPILLPDAYPMAEVPAGGYKPEDVPADVNAKLVAFDKKFTDMVTALQAAWENEDPIKAKQKLGESVLAMYALTSLAVTLMNTPRTSGGGNYGPCFRLV
jgi:Ferritin-like